MTIKDIHRKSGFFGLILLLQVTFVPAISSNSASLLSAIDNDKNTADKAVVAAVTEDGQRNNNNFDLLDQGVLDDLEKLASSHSVTDSVTTAVNEQSNQPQNDADGLKQYHSDRKEESTQRQTTNQQLQQHFDLLDQDVLDDLEKLASSHSVTDPVTTAVNEESNQPQNDADQSGKYHSDRKEESTQQPTTNQQQQQQSFDSDVALDDSFERMLQEGIKNGYFNSNDFYSDSGDETNSNKDDLQKESSDSNLEYGPFSEDYYKKRDDTRSERKDDSIENSDETNYFRKIPSGSDRLRENELESMMRKEPTTSGNDVDRLGIDDSKRTEDNFDFHFNDLPNNHVYNSFDTMHVDDYYPANEASPNKRSKQTSTDDYLLPPEYRTPTTSIGSYGDYFSTFGRDVEQQNPNYNSKSPFSLQEPVYNGKSAFSQQEPVYNGKSAFSQQEPVYNARSSFNRQEPIYNARSGLGQQEPIYNARSSGFSQQEPISPGINSNYFGFPQSDYQKYFAAGPATVDNGNYLNLFPNIRGGYESNFGYDDNAVHGPSPPKNFEYSPPFSTPFNSIEDNFYRYFPLAKLLFPFKRGFTSIPSLPTISPFAIDPDSILRDVIANGKMKQTNMQREDQGPYQVTKITYASDPNDRNFKGQAEFVTAEPKELAKTVANSSRQILNGRPSNGSPAHPIEKDSVFNPVTTPSWRQFLRD